MAALEDYGPDDLHRVPEEELEQYPALRQSLADLIEQFGDRDNPDPLHPDLQEYVEESSLGGQALRHPLVYQIFYSPNLNRQVNGFYEQKREAIRQAMADGKYSTVIWLHERPWRLYALSKIAHHLGDQAYWAALGMIWTDSENIWQEYQAWHDALHSGRSCRWAMMGKAEREVVRKLRRRKRPVLIYRGYAHWRGDQGMSWTLDKRRAKWFARRFAGLEDREHPCVAAGLIDGEDIIAYFADRNEEEIVCLPEDVTVLRVEEL